MLSILRGFLAVPKTKEGYLLNNTFAKKLWDLGHLHCMFKALGLATWMPSTWTMEITSVPESIIALTVSKSPFSAASIRGEFWTGFGIHTSTSRPSLPSFWHSPATDRQGEPDEAPLTQGLTTVAGCPPSGAGRAAAAAEMGGPISPLGSPGFTLAQQAGLRRYRAGKFTN